MSPRLIPDPPALAPPGVHQSDYIARLNRAANRFDVYPYQPGKYTQLELDSEDPIASGRDLKIGPPSQVPDWHPLLHKWGLQVMAAAGFVNSTAYSAPGQFYLPLGRLAKITDDQPIHPVLREDMWHNLLPDEYKLMEPALRLASAILDDPETLHFFAGLTIPTRQMPCRMIPHIGICPVFNVSDPLSAAGLRNTYNRLVDMRNSMRWCLQPQEMMMQRFGAFGVTQAMVDDNDNTIEGARGPATRCSVCHVSRGYTDALRMYLGSHPSKIGLGRFINDTQFLAEIPLQDTIIIDEESAIIRSTLLMADTIVHEFTHAVNAAYFDYTAVMSPVAGSTPQVWEPYFAGDRANEVGHVVSSFVFRGNPQAITQFSIPQTQLSHNQQQHIGTLGMFWTNKWDRWRRDNGGTGGLGASRIIDDIDFSTPGLYYPVPQAHTQKLFSTRLWQDEIHRFGLNALRFPILDKWAAEWTPPMYEQGIWGTGSFNVGPAPSSP
ncbi:hypothetical protein D6C77_07937 [Aureobasidium pullulans]|nr:hypothetical protein D6C77_07937 [Aureobasidium pullulans]